MSTDVTALVVGAGLAGLSASVHLRRKGIPHRLIERGGKACGLAATWTEAGYRFDITGHLFHAKDPAIAAWVRELLGPGAWLEIDRKSVVYSNGVTTKYPFQANVAGLPKELAYACVRDFVQATTTVSSAPIRTFEEYCLRHFGEAISRAFMIPYNEKLWGVHPREITASWCDRFVPRPSLDDVLRGAFGVDPPELGYNTKLLYPRLGMGALGEALIERAAPIDLATQPVAISAGERRARLSNGDELRYRTLISSMPLPALIDCITDAPAELLEARKLLRATSLHYLDLALNTPCERPYHWCYVPEPRFSFYRVGCYSNFSAAMAPAGKACLYVELSSREAPVLSQVVPEVAAGLVEMGWIRAPEAIRFARARCVDPAYVIYDERREQAMAVIQPYLERVGIQSIGRYGAWVYSSMEDALIAGREAAAAS